MKCISGPGLAQVLEVSLGVVHGATQHAVERISTALEELREQVTGNRGRWVGRMFLIVDQDLRQDDRRDVLAGLVVDDLDLFADLEQLCDSLERDVATGFSVVQLPIRVALDQDHMP